MKFVDVVLGHWVWLGRVIYGFFSTRDLCLYFCFLYVEDITYLTFTRMS